MNPTNRGNSFIGAGLTNCMSRKSARNKKCTKRSNLHFLADLCVQNMCSKHDSPELKKFVCWRSIYNICFPKMGWYTWLTPNEGIPVFTVDQHPICAEYRLEMWLQRTEEFHVLALNLQVICFENGFETWLTPCEEIHVFTVDIHSICAKRARNITRANWMTLRWIWSRTWFAPVVYLQPRSLLGFRLF